MNLMHLAEETASKRKTGQKIYGTTLATFLSFRTIVAKLIQKRHRNLVKSMKEFGMLQTKYEDTYPRDWINPTTVAKTHPVFYVNYKGNLVFPKMTRTEYARYVFQQKWPGKLGLNPWRWRAYIEPPKAPKKVRERAAEKAAEWAKALRPKPAFGHARARAAMPKKAKAKPRRRLK